MASSSCSTTTTVLPRSRKRVSVSSRRLLSRWCGLCLAHQAHKGHLSGRNRFAKQDGCWLSPPDNVPLLRDRVRYSSPTSLIFQPLANSLQNPPAICFCLAFSFFSSLLNHSSLREWTFATLGRHANRQFSRPGFGLQAIAAKHRNRRDD